VRVALLGLGLIGGSIARALQLEPTTADWHVVAWSPSGRGPATAAADGVIEAVARTPMAAIAGADLVVLAAPATDCLALLDGLAGPWRSALAPGAVVTDVASTKGAIVRRAESLGVRFVGGHPMAGREATGYEAATADLFANRPWIVVPATTAGEAETAIVASLARACGARPVVMSAEDHDATVAGISHLPLIASVALVEAVAGAAGGPASPDWPESAGLAAGAWRDMTRVARGDPRMGAAIAATNAPAIARRLRAYRAVIDDWLTALEAPDGPDEAALAARLEAVRARLESRPDG
jgi:prephenate dehydrogenase